MLVESFLTNGKTTLAVNIAHKKDKSILVLPLFLDSKIVLLWQKMMIIIDDVMKDKSIKIVSLL